MEKRYQVFVSSTYEDLKVERQEVFQSLLESDCIPVGMEFFPAANNTAWEIIKSVIKDSDYYVVIVAGRYGSLSPERISYTQKEYDFAVEQGIPVMAFLHGDPGKIPAEKTDGNDESRKMLEQFRESCKEKLCKYWTTADGLGGAVVKSLNQLKKTAPGIGWVRADQVSSESATKDILRLKNRVEELEHELEESSTKPPVDAEKLQQGEDVFEMDVRVDMFDPESNQEWDVEVKVPRSWDSIFNTLAPTMISEAEQTRLKTLLGRGIEREELEVALAARSKRYDTVSDWEISSDSFHTVLIQLRSLGLIVQSIKPRSMKDIATYWKLTPYGDKVMTRMRALKRKE